MEAPAPVQAPPRPTTETTPSPTVLPSVLRQNNPPPGELPKNIGAAATSMHGADKLVPIGREQLVHKPATTGEENPSLETVQIPAQTLPDVSPNGTAANLSLEAATNGMGRNNPENLSAGQSGEIPTVSVNGTGLENTQAAGAGLTPDQIPIAAIAGGLGAENPQSEGTVSTLTPDQAEADRVFRPRPDIPPGVPPAPNGNGRNEIADGVGPIPDMVAQPPPELQRELGTSITPGRSENREDFAELPAQRDTLTERFREESNRRLRSLRRTQFFRNLRNGILITLVPLITGLANPGGGPSVEANSPQTPDQTPIATSTNEPFDQRFTEIFKQGHKKLLEMLDKKGRSTGRGDPFMIPGPERTVISVEPTKPKAPEIPIPAGEPGYELRTDETGESAKGMAEKYFAIFSDRLAAIRTLVNLEKQGVSVNIDGYLEDVAAGNIDKANQIIIDALQVGEKRGIQLPGEIYAQAIKNADPETRDLFVQRFTASIGRSNPDTPLAGDQLTTRVTGVEDPYKLYKGAVSKISSSQQTRNSAM